MAGRLKVLHFFRKLHMYIGIFTAPAILFFAFTGALQTFSLHESARDGSYTPQRWILVLAQIHKKQTVQVPPPKSGGDAARLKNKPTGSEDVVKPAPPKPRKGHTLPLKIFFLLVSIGLFVSTITGLYMTWKIQRKRLVSVLLFLAGIIIPILLMAV
jgi:hypothetical protein